MSYRRVLTLIALISLPASGAIHTHDTKTNPATADSGTIKVFADI